MSTAPAPKRRRKTKPGRARGPREPRQSRSKQTVRAILEATERILGADGLAGIAMTRVALLAGVSVGSLYEYFPTREALISAVEERSWSAQVGKLVSKVAAVESLAPEDGARELVVFAMNLMFERGQAHGITADDPATREARLEIVERIADFVEASLRPSVARHRHPDARRASIFVIKTVAALAWLGQRDHADLVRTGEFQALTADMVARFLFHDV
jgi:AcrR family transcriptional regulator